MNHVEKQTDKKTFSQDSVAALVFQVSAVYLECGFDFSLLCSDDNCSVCHQLPGSLNVLVLLGIYTACTSKLKIVKMYLK